MVLVRDVIPFKTVSASDTLIFFDLRHPLNPYRGHNEILFLTITSQISDDDPDKP